jgi:hypothetical protein
MELAVLTPQTAELFALCRRQAILTAIFITVGLGNPIAVRPTARTPYSQFHRPATGSNQLYHLPAKVRRIGWVLSCHCGIPKFKRSGVHESGA